MKGDDINELFDIIRAQVLIFDLDNTLYPSDTPIFPQIEAKMSHFISELLEIDHSTALALQTDYHYRYGTTLRGLMNHHQIDPMHFLDYTHDIDVSVVKPNQELGQLLDKLDAKKIVFTNGSKQHAKNILTRLGILEHFHDIFDLVDANYIPKPHLETYFKLCETHRIHAQHAVLFEDMVCNLIPAAEMGMTTVLVKSHNPKAMDGHEDQRIHFRADNLTEFLSDACEVFES